MTTYWSCITCGHLTQAVTGFCSYCSSPLSDFLHSPEAEEVSQGLFLGHLHDGSPFHLPLSNLGLHVAVYGVTGSGKSRLAMLLIREAERAGINVTILDIDGEWRNLLPQFQGETLYYSVGKNLRINPFELKDRGLVEMLLRETIFKGVETEYQDISPQMNFILTRCIEASNSIPDLLNNIAYYSDDNPFRLSNIDKTKTALTVRLEPLRSNPVLREIFYTNNSSIDLNRLDQRNLVIDLHPLDREVAYRKELRLIYNTISTAYLRQALKRTPTDRVTHMFVAEEAQMLAPRILKKAVVTDTWASTEFATRLRKRGVCMVTISQSPENIEPDLRKNSQNVFTFRLTAAEDVGIISKSLGHNWYTALDWLTFYISNLKERETLVKVPNISEPFIIKAREVRYNRLSGSEVERYCPDMKENLEGDEESFLASLKEYPYASMVERRARLGWEEGRYARVVKELTDKGIIRKIHVSLGKGRPKVLYELKAQKPSVKHQYYVYWIVQQLAGRGYICRVEGKGPDIVVPQMSTAINVELGKSKIEDNIRLALQHYSKVIVCSDDSSLLQSLSQRIKDARVLFSAVAEVPSLLGVDAN